MPRFLLCVATVSVDGGRINVEVLVRWLCLSSLQLQLESLIFGGKNKYVELLLEILVLNV